MPDSNEPVVPTGKKVRSLVHPKNLLKTVVSQIPFASAGVEMMNQWESVEMDGRVSAVESDVDALKKLREAEMSVPAEKPAEGDAWPLAVGEFSRRSVELVVVYFTPDRPNSEFVVPMAHGCVIGDGLVLTCRRALNEANALAAETHGRVIIFHWLAWYDFTTEKETDKNGSGLVLCELGKRDEEKWAESKRDLPLREQLGWFEPPPTAIVKTTLQPWEGQEIGWLVATEGKGISRGPEFSALEFQNSIIAQFWRPSNEVLKWFITGVVNAALLRVGSAVFSKDEILLGIITGVVKYEHDRGHRVVVNALLPHPYFMELHRAKGDFSRKAAPAAK